MQIFPIRVLQFRGHLNACHHQSCPLKASQEILSPKCPLTSFTSVIVTKVFLNEATRMLVKLLMGNLDDKVLSTYIHH